MICKYSLALLSLFGHFHDAKGFLPRNKIFINHGLSSTHWATVTLEKKQDYEHLDEMEEIEALGGDSFFLESSTDKEKPKVHTNSDERISQIEAMGGDPFFLSDDDDDYSDTLDFDDNDKDQDHFSAEAALNMMAMSSALGGGVMDLIDSKDEMEKNPVEKQQSREATSQDSKVSSSTSLLESKYDRVMEMGGDPFFLSDDDDENDENVADGVDNQNDDDNDDDDDGALTPEAFLAMAYSKVPNDDGDLVQDDEDDDGALTPEAFLAMAYSKVPTKENGEIAGTSESEVTMEDQNDDSDNDDTGDNSWEWDGSVDEDAHMGF